MGLGFTWRFRVARQRTTRELRAGSHGRSRSGRALGASVTAALPAQHSLSASSRRASSTRVIRRPGQSRPDGECCPAGLDPVDALAAGPFGWPCLRLSPYALSMRSRGHAAKLFFVCAMNRQGTHSSCAHQSKPRPPAPPGRGQCQTARLHGAGSTPRESRCSSELFLRLTYARCWHRFLASSEGRKPLSMLYFYRGS